MSKPETSADIEAEIERLRAQLEIVDSKIANLERIINEIAEREGTGMNEETTTPLGRLAAELAAIDEAERALAVRRDKALRAVADLLGADREQETQAEPEAPAECQPAALPPPAKPKSRRRKERLCSFVAPDGTPCGRNRVVREPESLCNAHYQQLRRGKPLTPVRPVKRRRKRSESETQPALKPDPETGECSVSGCWKPLHSRGLCADCYKAEYSKPKFTYKKDERAILEFCEAYPLAVGMTPALAAKRLSGKGIKPIQIAKAEREPDCHIARKIKELIGQHMIETICEREPEPESWLNDLTPGVFHRIA